MFTDNSNPSPAHTYLFVVRQRYNPSQKSWDWWSENVNIPPLPPTSNVVSVEVKFRCINNYPNNNIAWKEEGGSENIFIAIELLIFE